MRGVCLKGNDRGNSEAHWILLTVFLAIAATGLSQPTLLDETFAPELGTNQNLRAVAIQPDGRVLILGGFIDVQGGRRNGIAACMAMDRWTLPSHHWLDASGERRVSITLDGTPCVGVPQADGRVIVSGFWPSWNFRIARLLEDGSVDDSFQQTSLLPLRVSVRTPIALQSTGKLVLALADPDIDLRPRFLARFHADGTRDAGFGGTLPANDSINALLVLPDDRLLLIGEFTKLGTLPRARLAVLNEDGPVVGVPKLRPVPGPPQGRFTFTIDSTDDFAFSPLVIESSDNLVDWIPLHTNTPPTALREFSDSTQPVEFHRYYRVTLP